MLRAVTDRFPLTGMYVNNNNNNNNNTTTTIINFPVVITAGLFIRVSQITNSKTPSCYVASSPVIKVICFAFNAM